MDFLIQIIHTLNQPLKMKIAKSDIMARKWCLPQINFAKEQMTSYGGLVVFKPLLERLRIAQKLESCCRHLQAGSHYRFGRIVQLLVIHILLGFRPLRDIDFYKEDPLVRQIAGMKRLPSVPTISRMLEQFDERSLLGLEKTNTKLVLQRLQQEGLARITLDFDGSVLSARRQAEGMAVGFNRKKKGQRSYYPLFCTVAQSGQVLALLHRSGNVHDSNGAIEFVCRCVQTVREALPAAKVETRMDSAFFSDEMVQALEALKLEYTISVPFARLAALKDLVEKRWLWWQLRSGEKELGYFEKRWKPKSWGQRNRFVFIRAEVNLQTKRPLQLDLFEPRQRGYLFKVIVTNKKCISRKVVRFHEGRGAQESIFGELKNHGQMDYIPSRRWNANKVFLLANLLAHNLTRELQMERATTRLHTNEKRSTLWKFENWHTLRRNLLLKAGRLSRPNGRWTLTFNKNAAVERLLLSFLPSQT